MTAVSGAEEVDGCAASIQQTVVQNAEVKARSVLGRLRNHANCDDSWLVLAADTLVVMGDQVYGKPRHWQEAERFLVELGGKPHQVMTGVCLIHVTSGARHRFCETTTVELKSLNHEQIETLFRRVDPMDKAAGYGYQDAPHIVAKMEGSQTNVMGLPMTRLRLELEQWWPKAIASV